MHTKVYIIQFKIQSCIHVSTVMTFEAVYSTS